MGGNSDEQRGRAPRRQPRGAGAARGADAGRSERAAQLTRSQQRLLEDWAGFGGRLVAALAGLEDDDYLIIGIRGSNRFVQFAGQGAYGLRAESVSNFYLPEDEQLGEAQHALLLRLGWNAPSNLPDQFGHEPAGSPNYFVDLRPPLDLREIAALAVNTLIGPLDADHPHDLEYRSFSEAGESIRWPALGLRRRLG